MGLVRDNALFDFSTNASLAPTQWTFHRKAVELFPLNRRRRFSRNIVNHAIETAYLVDDAVRDLR